MFDDPKMKVKKLWYNILVDLEFGLSEQLNSGGTTVPKTDKRDEGDVDVNGYTAIDADAETLFFDKLKGFANTISFSLPNFDAIGNRSNTDNSDSNNIVRSSVQFNTKDAQISNGVNGDDHHMSQEALRVSNYVFVNYFYLIF